MKHFDPKFAVAIAMTMPKPRECLSMQLSDSYTVSAAMGHLNQVLRKLGGTKPIAVYMSAKLYFRHINWCSQQAHTEVVHAPMVVFDGLPHQKIPIPIKIIIYGMASTEKDWDDWIYVECSQPEIYHDTVNGVTYRVRLGVYQGKHDVLIDDESRIKYIRRVDYLNRLLHYEQIF